MTTLDALKTLLANTYSLASQAHLAHWNVTGRTFFSLHTEFGKQYSSLYDAADVIAERIRALKSPAIGGLSKLASVSKVKEASSILLPGEICVSNLISGHTTCRDYAVSLRDIAGKEGDKESENLAIERITDHEKAIWMLSSYQE